MSQPETQIFKRQLKVSVLVLVIFAVMSTAGFYVLGEGRRGMIDCLYLTAGYFSTVGDNPFSGTFSEREELWALMVIIFGIGAAVYAFGSVMALITSGELQRSIGRRQLAKRLESLDNHYIVCGFGRMGSGICRALARKGARFVLIDAAEGPIEEAAELGYVTTLGDAADEIVLKQVAIDRARGLVTCLPHDPDNIFVTLTARGLNAHLLIIARAEILATEQRLIRAGADRVICPSVIGATKITRMLLHPAVDDLMDAATEEDFNIDRIAVSSLTNLAGKSLRDAALPSRYGIMVLAVERPGRNRLFNPAADHLLTNEEQLIVAGPHEAIERFLKYSSE